MNQHDQMQQMREALRSALSLIDGMEQNYGNLWMLESSPEDVDRVRLQISQALATEPEPNTGQIDPEVMQVIQENWAELTAEPAPLVRLTDDSLISIYLTCKAEWKATNKRERERIAVLFGHAIMDAMERVNK